MPLDAGTVIFTGTDTLDHHLLGVHHLISGEYQTLADILFLVFGALLVGGGWLLQHSGQPINLGGG